MIGKQESPELQKIRQTLKEVAKEIVDKVEGAKRNGEKLTEYQEIWYGLVKKDAEKD